MLKIQLIVEELDKELRVDKYIANNYDKEREIKLFSFNQKEILTICTDEQSCNKQISQYETLHKFFGMPRVSQYNEIEHAYKISMVDVLSRPSDDEAIKDIVDCMMKYRKQNDSNVISISEILNFESFCLRYFIMQSTISLIASSSDGRDKTSTMEIL